MIEAYRIDMLLDGVADMRPKLRVGGTAAASNDMPRPTARQGRRHRVSCNAGPQQRGDDNAAACKARACRFLAACMDWRVHTCVGQQAERWPACTCCRCGVCCNLQELVCDERLSKAAKQRYAAAVLAPGDKLAKSDMQVGAEGGGVRGSEGA